MQIERLPVKLEIANVSDAEDICNLLNVAYRGETGWTTESKLVEGERAVVNDILLSINSEYARFLVYKKSNVLIACICVEKSGSSVYIGSLAVNPEHQEAGLGKKVLELAEQYASNEFKPDKYLMVVLSSRSELIAYYERRGYKRSGNVKEYPRHLNVGTPVVDNLTIEELYKYA